MDTGTRFSRTQRHSTVEAGQSEIGTSNHRERAAISCRSGSKVALVVDELQLEVNSSLKTKQK